MPVSGLGVGSDGKLVVSETQLTGGGKGISCKGTGALRSVRVIYCTAQDPLFFFEVDSSLPGGACSGRFAGTGSCSGIHDRPHQQRVLAAKKSTDSSFPDKDLVKMMAFEKLCKTSGATLHVPLERLKNSMEKEQ